MESYEIDVIKMEKLKAMRRYRTFRKMATIVRAFEIFIAIMIVSWSISSVSAYMPAAVEFAGKFLRRISSLFFSPHFVFVLGNVIVITLFAKSTDRTSSCENFAGDVLSGDVLVEERESEKENSVAVNETVTVPDEEEEEKESERKTYGRTRSSLEIVIVDEKEKKKKELRRSETEPRRKMGNRESTTAKRTRVYEVDELSNDEFRRKVEAFIEKQQRLLREESPPYDIPYGHVASGARELDAPSQKSYKGIPNIMKEISYILGLEC
ncbi:hypothetical protein Cgig2_026491 [Carnegiea gigantea]|uniref:DUF4408 domain-containing protein n=1 Tax=Carnegiea gigantea TaxID=171969 RepID=A0A9Q1KFH3_9CARY|nr:hypothetical protein Cgig2_026491 [Carnegiea gigantea]